MGRLYVTANAHAVLTNDNVWVALCRHLRGDWGEVDEHDRLENEFSLARGLRLLSVYHSANGVNFWIITEADRSATTVLLPEDY